MHGADSASRGRRSVRWILIALLILLGIALFFWYAPTTQPAAPPSGMEEP